MGKLKTWGFAVFAVLAISAVASASAFAEYHIASGSGGTVTGQQLTTNELFTNVGTQKCTTLTFSGSQATETASALTVHPEYSRCTLAGQRINYITTGCNYEFQKPSTGPPPMADMKIACSGSNVILIKDTNGLGCEVKFGPQGPLGDVAFTNNPVIGGIPQTGKVLVTFEIVGLSYTYTAGCPNSGGSAGSGTNGQYKGSALFTGSAALSVT
jgi:hypothetical protein